MNGGTCIERCLTPKEKFICKCPRGYIGKLCETLITSCMDVLVTSKSFPNDGVYYLERSDNSKIIPVFCSFEQPNRAWVLIESFSLGNNNEFKELPFYKNETKNSDHPPNWNSYRMGLGIMQYLRNKASLVRATCNFPIRPGSLRPDYLLGKLTAFNILQKGDVFQCFKYLEINIRNNSCTECNVVTIHKPCCHLHIDVTEKVGSCSAGVKPPDAVASEDSFGFYNDYVVVHSLPVAYHVTFAFTVTHSLHVHRHLKSGAIWYSMAIFLFEKKCIHLINNSRRVTSVGDRVFVSIQN